MTGVFIKRGNLGTDMHIGRKNATWKWRQRSGWCRSQEDRREAWSRLSPQSPGGISSANPRFQVSKLQNSNAIQFWSLSYSVVMLCYDSRRKLTQSLMTEADEGQNKRDSPPSSETLDLTMRKLHKVVASTQQNPGLTVKKSSAW